MNNAKIAPNSPNEIKYAYSIILADIYYNSHSLHADFCTYWCNYMGKSIHFLHYDILFSVVSFVWLYVFTSQYIITIIVHGLCLRNIMYSKWNIVISQRKYALAYINTYIQHACQTYTNRSMEVLPLNQSDFVVKSLKGLIVNNSICPFITVTNEYHEYLLYYNHFSGYSLTIEWFGLLKSSYKYWATYNTTFNSFFMILAIFTEHKKPLKKKNRKRKERIKSEKNSFDFSYVWNFYRNIQLQMVLLDTNFQKFNLNDFQKFNLSKLTRVNTLKSLVKSIVIFYAKWQC